MTECPSCRAPMRLVVESDVDIDVCDDCHGVWLDPGELDALADSQSFSPRDFTSDQLGTLKCPRCRTRKFASIHMPFGVLTRCADCGGVFVGGETLDCITKCERSELKGSKMAETMLT